MKRFSEVRVFNPEGKLKETISVDSLCKTLWEKAAIEDGHTSIPTNHKVGTRATVYKKKVFPMIICAYKPCSKSIQKINSKHFFCIDRADPRNSCKFKNRKAEIKANAERRDKLRKAGKIIRNCPKCKKDFPETMSKQRYCRNPCRSMTTPTPKVIEDITCKRCKKVSRGVPSRATMYCGNPCTYELHRRDLVAVKVDKICVLCKKVYKGRKTINSMYCHNPCNWKLAKGDSS